jgi:heme A synthase
VAVLGAMAWLLWTSIASRQRRFVALGAALFALVLGQATLGAVTVLSGKAVLPTTAHVATGAAILAGSFLAALRAWRTLDRPQARALPAGLPARS